MSGASQLISLSIEAEQNDVSNDTDARVPSLTLLAVIFIMALLPLLTTPILPFIDFYNHIARYFILAHLSQDLVLQRFYVSNWSLLPNIGLDMLATPVLWLAPPWIGGHLLAALIMLTQYCGVLYFHRALTGRVSLVVAILLVPMLYSYILFWGFGSFVFGLGLAFAAAGWWLNHRAMPWRAFPVAAIFAVAIFLTHGFAFALYGVLIASLELGSETRGRGWSVKISARRLAPVVAQAVIPAGLFLMTATLSSAGGVSNVDRSIMRLLDHGSLLHRLGEIALYRLETIVRVAEGPSVGADVIWFAAMAGVVAFLLCTKRLALVRAVWLAVAIGMLLVLIVPPAMFGVGYVSDRIPFYVALLFIAGLSPTAIADRGRAAALTAITVLAGIRLISIALSWQSYARDYRDFETVARAIPTGSLVADLMVGGIAHSSRAPRCGMYGPSLVIGYHQAVPLFANDTQQPMRQIGRLAAGVAAFQPAVGTWVGVNPDEYDRYLEALRAAGYFQYVLVCNANLLPRPLPTFAKIVSQTPRFELLRLY